MIIKFAFLLPRTLMYAFKGFLSYRVISLIAAYQTGEGSRSHVICLNGYLARKRHNRALPSFCRWFCQLNSCDCGTKLLLQETGRPLTWNLEIKPHVNVRVHNSCWLHRIKVGAEARSFICPDTSCIKADRYCFFNTPLFRVRCWAQACIMPFF